MKRWITFLIIGVVVVGAAVGVVLSRRSQRLASAEGLQTVEAVSGPLTALVGATGTVRANQSATLVFQTSGTVDRVLAAVGDRTRRGEELVTLAASSLPQQVILAQADLVEAQRALDNLLHSDLAAAQAQLAVAQARDEVHDAEYNRTVNQQGNRGSAETISIARARLLLAQQRFDQARDIYDRFSAADASDPNRAGALSAYGSARDALRTAERTLNWYLAGPNEIDQLLFDSNVAIAHAHLDDAERELERLQNGPDPADLAAAQARVDAAQAAVDLAHITAPFPGTITRVDVMPGDLVSVGTVAMTLDDLSRLLVDVEVSEVDINRVAASQPVSLTFDGIPGRTYTGQVTEVGLTGTLAQGIVNFQVTVEILDADDSVRPGMTAAVNIVVEQIEDVLLVPNRAVRVQDGQRIVYVLRDGQTVAVPIVLGASSDAESQVVEGDLAVGDLIVLNPPLELEQGGPGSFFGQ